MTVNGDGPRQVLVRPAPLRQAVYDALVEMIITRKLLPGQHLVEKDLVAALGVSRQPIREALQRMQTDGWVDQRPAQGAFVHSPTAEEADQLLGVRSVLEAESARLAASHCSPDHTDRLLELQRAGEEALTVGEPNALVSANAHFHAYIASMSGNEILADMISSMDRRIQWYYRPVVGNRGKQSWIEHAEIIDAISNRNTRRAQTLMRQHTERTRDAYRNCSQSPSGG